MVESVCGIGGGSDIDASCSVRVGGSSDLFLSVYTGYLLMGSTDMGTGGGVGEIRGSIVRVGE